MRSLGLDVEVVRSTYEEPPHDHLDPRELAVVHAREKALDVRARRQDAPLVAADTVVDVDGTAFNKPADAADARRMLGILSGRDHVVHTAFTFIAQDGTQTSGVESTRVRFFALTPYEIDAYVASGEPMDKAGAYGIQGIGATLVERIEGDFYTVMGFPLGRFVRALANVDYVLTASAIRSR